MLGHYNVPLRIRVKPSISTHSKPCTMSRTRLLKYFVLQHSVTKTKHGVPHLHSFHYRGSHNHDFWLMYAQVGIFALVGDPL